MGFSNNSKLITSAAKVQIAANGETGNVYSGSAGADAYIVAGGTIGDDLLIGFSGNDTLIFSQRLTGTSEQIGSSQALGIHYEGAASERFDTLTVMGIGEKLVTTLRYLGAKDGGFAYADAATRDLLFADAALAQHVKIDNAVTSNEVNMASGSVALLTDNALGLNFGGDTIVGFGDDDLLIFTTKIVDKDGTGEVTFGRNLVLDTSGADGPLDSDAYGGPGGQMDLRPSEQKSVFFLGEKTIEGHTYYYYGSAHAALPDSMIAV